MLATTSGRLRVAAAVILIGGVAGAIWIYLSAAPPDDALSRAHSLLEERAGLLDEADRATFLGNVPAHRAIMTAWAASRTAQTP